MKYAIIGGIGSGKSLALDFFAQKGCATFDCDIIAKEITSKPDCQEQLKNAFPNAVLDNKIDSKILGQIVFDDKEKLLKLNKIVHPKVTQRLLELISQTQEKNIFVEISAFVGSGIENYFDKIICIIASETSRINRIMQRNNFSYEHSKKIISMQPSQNLLVGLSDICIYNDEDLESLHFQLEEIYLELK